MTDLSRAAIPAAAGIGLRHTHMAAFAQEADAAPRAVPWLEIHNENFLNAGGPRQAMLRAIAARYPIGCHGVGLSLGSAEGLDTDHLKRLAALFAWVKPGLVSEHLAWSVTDGVYLNDLLPLPYTAASLEIVARNVDQAQAAFGRQILVENPSAYLSFAATEMTEPDFLNALVKRTGCGLLLDLNNIYVTCANTGGDALTYIDAIDGAAVGEMHLAGHSRRGAGEDLVLVDTHSTLVCAHVWDLYTHALRRIGARPTLMEWDLDVPALSVLLEEAHRAQMLIDTAGSMPRVA
jgi:uncharacterized protein (UPF0276 family)